MKQKMSEKFEIPDKVLEQIYELTGDGTKYKGFILVCSNEQGEPLVYSRFDSQMTELAVQRAATKYLSGLDEE